MYLADCHLHTHHSPDSESGLRDVCEAGLRAGLSALTVTDHVEMSWFVGGGYDRSSAASFEETSRFAAEYRERLLILRGVELGEPLEDQEAARLVREALEPWTGRTGSSLSAGTTTDRPWPGRRGRWG